VKSTEDTSLLCSFFNIFKVKEQASTMVKSKEAEEKKQKKEDKERKTKS